MHYTILIFSFSRKRLGYCHPSVRIGGVFTVGGPKNVFLYEGVSIGGGHVSATNAKFVMKKIVSVQQD